MPPAVRGIGHLSLTVAPAVLLVAAALGAARAVELVPPSVIWLAAVPLIACVSYVAGLEADAVLGGWNTRVSIPDPADTATTLAVTAGALLTRILAFDLGLGVIVAAALVGLLADRLLPSYGAAVYCGAFVGMASPAVFATLPAVTAAGLVAGMVFVAAEQVFDGFGGKLGTVAFVGCAVIALALGAEGGSGTAVSGTTAVGFALAGAAAAGITYLSSVYLNHGPVRASALTGLVGGLVCPAPPVVGDGIAAVVFCASFAGMASRTVSRAYVRWRSRGRSTACSSPPPAPSSSGSAGNSGRSRSWPASSSAGCSSSAPTPSPPRSPLRPTGSGPDGPPPGYPSPGGTASTGIDAPRITRSVVLPACRIRSIPLRPWVPITVTLRRVRGSPRPVCPGAGAARVRQNCAGRDIEPRSLRSRCSLRSLFQTRVTDSLDSALRRDETPRWCVAFDRTALAGI